MTDRVRLRDVTLDDADLLDVWNADEGARSVFNDFGEPPSRAPRDVLIRGPLRNEHNGMFMVERASDSVAIGTVGWHRVRYGPARAEPPYIRSVQQRRSQRCVTTV